MTRAVRCWIRCGVIDRARGAARPPVLVIGYGSTLHSDDGVGPLIAETIGHWRMPHVTALAVTQLTPDLAERVSRAHDVYFVDAALPSAHRTGAPFHLEPVDPDEPPAGSDAPAMTRPVDGHLCDPRTLLTLSRMLYAAAPRAWLLSVPGHNFELGESLTPQCRHAMAQVLAFLHERVLGSLS